ncbi:MULTISPECIES: YifB family Mg chelatase-like AAA ATPase [Marichromatium]|uniref:Magnesium chelatase family protein n=2 Tax=Marichromatium gracile TaxID=1048 RepID=A0A4V6P4V0_MARGR|nr:MULTISPECIES: YifB family Mg chelatase-like AAA ATPase [Marichromatium]MBK1707781.1 ATP-dependent protease [Marichromatium gracile]RNE93111.1 ATP-dependent protease [Marichromatium sp. AB32]TCW39770.1 magnesium chelatase family protein [Marichromatium gracile]
MALCTLHSRACVGISAPAVAVEVHLSSGLPALSLVGLPEAAVRESKERVRGALLNARFRFPDGRLTINLAPADLPKEGGRFDLPIALGILGASGQLGAAELDDCECLGELALSGALRPVSGVIPAALAARAAGRTLILPRANAEEAALVGGLELLPAEHLGEVCEHLAGVRALRPHPQGSEVVTAPTVADLREVRGQAQAKRALEVAAAGGHSLLLIGPPGSGKSMLASRLPGLLPPLSEDEALESAAIRSVSASTPFDPARWRERPFRAPHHTASAVALVGGGGNPRPGEISLAHHGVLFLDELPEFDRRVLEVLREPLESGHIDISRAARQARFPARFQLVAAMNPCPCGYLGDPGGRCHCSREQVARYRARISGPLIDRIDLQLEVPRVELGALLAPSAPQAEDSATVRARVCAARERQQHRAGCANAALDTAGLERDCALEAAGVRMMEQAMARLGLSARAYHRVLKVARTIADLEGATRIAPAHLGEAIGYRRLDRAAERP